MDKGLCLVSGIYPPDSGGPAKFTFDFERFARVKVPHVDVIATTSARSLTVHLENGSLYKISRRSNTLFRCLKFVVRLKSLQRKNRHFLVTGAFLEFYVARIRKDSKVIFKIPGDIVWEKARNDGATLLPIDDFQSSKLSLKLKMMRRFYTSSISRADKVIVPSEGLKLLTNKWGIDQSRVHLIFNSVDIDFFSLNKDDSEKVFDILTVCRLTKWKGVDEVIRVASDLDLTLAIVGDGPERAVLEKLAIELECKVHFFGDIDVTRVRHLYQTSKRFVLNSNYEGLPHVLLEARASRLLCIAKEDTGSSEVINHLEDGILFGNNSGLDLTQAVLLSFSDEIDAIAFTTKAFDDLKVRFDQNINFQKILDLFND